MNKEKLQAGKHVLCKKTIRLSVAASQELIMQAQKYLRQRFMVKRTLRKYGYPPDKQRRATDTVIQQAEMLAGEWGI